MAFIDQTQDFRALIAEGSGGPSKARPRPPRRKSDEEKRDSFLKEAYQIVSVFLRGTSTLASLLHGLLSPVGGEATLTSTTD